MVSAEVILILGALSVAFVIAEFSFARILNLLNISSSYLKVFLLLLNLVLYIFIYKDFDTISCSLVRVLAYKDFDFLEPFVRNLYVIF